MRVRDCLRVLIICCCSKAGCGGYGREGSSSHSSHTPPIFILHSLKDKRDKLMTFRLNSEGASSVREKGRWQVASDESDGSNELKRKWRQRRQDKP